MEESPLPLAIREQWPWPPRYARVNGWRMHYVDEGTGDLIVLLHGNPTWDFLYRAFVEPLTRAGHRVVIPDMIGFGLSEKPSREDAHSLDGQIANLTALLRRLDLRRITLVCATIGAADQGRFEAFGALGRQMRGKRPFEDDRLRHPLSGRDSKRAPRGTVPLADLTASDSW